VAQPAVPNPVERHQWATLRPKELIDRMLVGTPRVVGKDTYVLVNRAAGLAYAEQPAPSCGAASIAGALSALARPRQFEDVRSLDTTAVDEPLLDYVDVLNVYRTLYKGDSLKYLFRCVSDKKGRVIPKPSTAPIGHGARMTECVLSLSQQLSAAGICMAQVMRSTLPTVHIRLDTLEAADKLSDMATRWTALKTEFKSPSTVLLIHLPKHCAMVFALREYVRSSDGVYICEVLTAKQGQRPKTWVNFADICKRKVHTLKRVSGSAQDLAQCIRAFRIATHAHVPIKPVVPRAAKVVAAKVTGTQAVASKPKKAQVAAAVVAAAVAPKIAGPRP